uniref:Pre-mRNA processing factor 4 (PRP4)-like domain-containing protein n=1 Tax=Romanomermis culicivorax TaxID=13658 RepID=A0A915J9B0_ROMCU
MQDDNIIIGDSNESNGSSNDKKDNMETANIFTSSEHMELEKFRDPHKESVLAEFERRKRARQMTLPTDDGEIKLMLRQLDQPICLFGEDKPDRRERLRTFLSMLDEEEAQRILRKEDPKVEKPKEENTTWYHRAGETLREARIFIAQYSLPRAQKRLEEARERKDIAPQVKAIKIQETNRWAQGLNNQCSQVGDTRPVAHCQFSPDSKYVATAGWSGLCKLWSLPDCQLVREYKGHTSRAGCITFHPDAKLDEAAPVVDEDNASTNVDLASCASDGSVLLWNYNNDTPLADIEGHQPYRVSKLRFHPSGRFLATTCFDNSWRLFDLQVKYIKEYCRKLFKVKLAKLDHMKIII